MVDNFWYQRRNTFIAKVPNFTMDVRMRNLDLPSDYFSPKPIRSNIFKPTETSERRKVHQKTCTHDFLKLGLFSRDLKQTEFNLPQLEKRFYSTQEKNAFILQNQQYAQIEKRELFQPALDSVIKVKRAHEHNEMLSTNYKQFANRVTKCFKRQSNKESTS